MKTRKEIEIMLGALVEELKAIERDIPHGQCYWRVCKSRIETLQWVIE